MAHKLLPLSPFLSQQSIWAILFSINSTTWCPGWHSSHWVTLNWWAPLGLKILGGIEICFLWWIWAHWRKMWWFTSVHFNQHYCEFLPVCKWKELNKKLTLKLQHWEDLDLSRTKPWPPGCLRSAAAFSGTIVTAFVPSQMDERLEFPVPPTQPPAGRNLRMAEMACEINGNTFLSLGDK